MLNRLVQALFRGRRPEEPIRVDGQRRESVRRPCCVPVDCLFGRGRVPGRVVDVSDGGLRLEFQESPPRLRTGDPFEVYFMGNLGQIPAERSIVVRLTWQRRIDGRLQAGVVFEDAILVLSRSWVPLVLRRLTASLRLSDERRHVRCPTNLEAALRLHPASRIEHWRGRLVDLSVGGAQLNSVALPVGTTASLVLPEIDDIPELMIMGRLVRSTTASAGMAFDPMTATNYTLLESVVRKQWASRHTSAMRNSC